MWMAENLNYADSVNYPSMISRNWCAEDADSCAKYGRYYTWSAAIDSVYWFDAKGIKCGYETDREEYQCSLPNRVQGICMEGWHLPNKEEWDELIYNVENNYRALLAKDIPIWKKATDEYGFTLLPTSCWGGCESDVLHWTSTDYSGTSAYDFLVHGGVYTNANSKYLGFSVRCIKDEDE